MTLIFEIPFWWVLLKLYFIGGTGLVFGIFTALWPRRSIGLYEWLMAKINWRVSPIDEAREVRTTRRFGTYLILLGGALLGLLLLRGI